MNNLLDLDNIEDFTNVCAEGGICPNKPIEIRNISGNQILKRPFLDHSLMLCKNNDTNLLSLLTGIDNKLNKNMNSIGENIPIFKNKVNMIIEEWPNNYSDITYDDIFRVKDNNDFDYNSLVSYNNEILELKNRMKLLEKSISNNENIRDELNDLQNKFLKCDNNINSCNNKLENIADNYNNDYSKILLDLSTKQKPFYLMKDNDSSLNNLSYENYHKKIPDNLSDMILNSLIIPNMILKEIEYLKSVLNKLKMNVNKSKQTILKLKENLPKSDTNSELSFGPLKQFFSSLIDSDSEDDSEEKDKIRESLSKIKDSKKFLVDTDSEEEEEKIDEDQQDEDQQDEDQQDEDEDLKNEDKIDEGNEDHEDYEYKGSISKIKNPTKIETDSVVENNISNLLNTNGDNLFQDINYDSEGSENIESDEEFNEENEFEKNNNLEGGSFKLRLDNFF